MLNTFSGFAGEHKPTFKSRFALVKVLSASSRNQPIPRAVIPKARLVIDLTAAEARALGFSGLAHVTVERIDDRS
jgi:hypothetical protein